MKTYFVIFLAVILVFSSCENIEDNSTVIQAEVDSTFFKANATLAGVGEDGSVTLQGLNADEVMTLHVKDLERRVFPLGGTNPNYATFEDSDGRIYSTTPNGSGEIVITNICGDCGFLVTGNFKFMAVLPGLDTIYVSRGVFYNVPYATGDPDSPLNAGSLSAEVDGVPFNTLTVAATDSGASIIISGSTASNSILLRVPLNVEVGNHPLPASGYQATYFSGNVTENASSGNISIITHDTTAKTISGTFSFQTANHTIASGQFNVTYN